MHGYCLNKILQHATSSRWPKLLRVKASLTKPNKMSNSHSFMKAKTFLIPTQILLAKIIQFPIYTFHQNIGLNSWRWWLVHQLSRCYKWRWQYNIGLGKMRVKAECWGVWWEQNALACAHIRNQDERRLVRLQGVLQSLSAMILQ